MREFPGVYLYSLIILFRRNASTRSHVHKCVLYTIPGRRWFLPKRPRVNKNECFGDEFLFCLKTMSEHSDPTTKDFLAILSM
jgi:hypothetical protein